MSVDSKFLSECCINKKKQTAIIFGTVSHMGDVFVRGQTRPLLKDRAAASPNFGGTPNYPHPFDAKRPNLAWYGNMGMFVIKSIK